MALQVQLVSPEKILWTGEAALVTTRTLGGGDITFLSGHAPFIGALGTHPVTIRPEQGDDVVVAVHGGFVEVANDRVTILSDLAELADDVDVARARAALERSEQAVKADPEDLEAQAAYARARNRVAVAGGATTASH